MDGEDDVGLGARAGLPGEGPWCLEALAEGAVAPWKTLKILKVTRRLDELELSLTHTYLMKL